MAPRTDDDELIQDVLAEGIEGLEGALDQLKCLHERPEDLGPLDALFRAFHSVKGNCAMVGLRAISQFAHRVEDALSTIIGTQTRVSRAQADLLAEAIDILIGMLGGDRDAYDDPVAADARAQYLSRLERNCGHGNDAELGLEPDDDAEAAFATAPPATTKAVHAAEGTALEAGQATSRDRTDKEKSAGNDSFRVQTSSMQGIMKLAGELFHLTEGLTRLSGTVAEGRIDGRVGTLLREISHAFDSATRGLYDQLLDIQKVPVTQLTRPLERIIRDTCRKQGKSIVLKIEGEDLQLDRRVIELVRDSIVHLIRNAVDHGIESPEVRASRGKDRSGTVRLEIAEHEESISFSMEDDGGGIDLAAVRDKAVRMGLVSREAADHLPDSAAIEFIFDPGFSTAKAVTDLSGRGVGMNVVADAIHGAGGTIRTTTNLGRGTRFELVVPKAGSPVVDGLVVRDGAMIYLVALKSVVRFHAWREVRIVRQAGTHDIGVLPEGSLNVINLRERAPNVEANVAVVVMDSQGRQAIVPVDEVLGRQKALVSRVEGDQVFFGRSAQAFAYGNEALGHLLDVDAVLAQCYQKKPKSRPPTTSTPS